MVSRPGTLPRRGGCEVWRRPAPPASYAPARWRAPGLAFERECDGLTFGRTYGKRAGVNDARNCVRSASPGGLFCALRRGGPHGIDPRIPASGPVHVRGFARLRSAQAGRCRRVATGRWPTIPTRNLRRLRDRRARTGLRRLCAGNRAAAKSERGISPSHVEGASAGPSGASRFRPRRRFRNGPGLFTNAPGQLISG